MSNAAIAIACDHAGLALKRELVVALEATGCLVTDLGTHGPESVDYPDFADTLAEALRDGRAERGILICGTGIGIAIAANRHVHVRAALCHDATTARLAREHNDANVLVLGARTIGIEVAKDCVAAFLHTRFAGGRHAGRVAKLNRPRHAAST